MMLGDLSKEDIEGNRGGAIGDPSVGQIRALAGVFGVQRRRLSDGAGAVPAERFLGVPAHRLATPAAA